MRWETFVAYPLRRRHDISIHSPHARGDMTRILGAQAANPFQSTPLMRGETDRHHAEGTDLLYFNPLPSCEGRQHEPRRMARGSNFNPLPSCEGRLAPTASARRSGLFQSTPLMRGETCQFIKTDCSIIFQSTPLMRGETHSHALQKVLPKYFNPLPSCEGRLHEHIVILPSC